VKSIAARLLNLKPLLWLRENPVILKEMRTRMRGWRAFLSLATFVTLVGGIVGMVYLGFAAANSITPSINARREFGQALFYTIYGLELLAVCTMAPALTSGAISTEKEQQTWELLRTTLITERALVLGKLIAAISFIVLLLFATLPVMSISFLFGGITLSQVLVGALIMLLTAITFGSLGLLFSSLIRRTRVSIVLSQSVGMFFTIGLPLFALVMYGFYEARTFSGTYTPPSPLEEIILLVTGWLIAITSPAVTAVVTEMILTADQNLFYTTTYAAGFNVIVPSPWLGFIVLYPVLSTLLLMLTTRVIRRAEKQ
jgi:ABC-type transport system involved in multi-copper enzyme maturation permease subunit